MLKVINCRTSIQALIVLVVVMLTGCISVPDSVKGTSPSPVQDLLSVKNAPELFIGQEGRFGGKVLDVVNENHRTRLEISSLPLASDASPELHEPSLGRVYAYVNSFLEPNDFKGNYVTVVGPIMGLEKGKIGHADYSYVVINATGYQRWRAVQRVLMPYGPGSWNYYGYPYYSGWGWNWYYPDPAPVETILTR
ncbi:Slp family lipoprotein [Photorhabdus asymbiotica]|uniref:Slp family lipoprotein n=1 Tax=Photorhabdus asymbiotica TaxID=291112 RepID=UPI003DA76273